MMNIFITNEWLSGDIESGWDIHWLFFGTYWKSEDFIGFSLGLFGFYFDICFNLGRGV